MALTGGSADGKADNNGRQVRTGNVLNTSRSDSQTLKLPGGSPGRLSHSSACGVASTGSEIR